MLENEVKIKRRPGNPNIKVWTEEELKLLSEKLPLFGARYVAGELGRSIPAVRMKAADLNIRSKTIRYWTEEDDALLKKYYPKKGGMFVAEKLGRSHKSVIGRTIRLGIRRLNFKPWQEWELRYLKRHYGSKTARSIGRSLSRSANAILTKAKILKLNKPHASYWSEDEIKLLLELYPKKSISITEIAQQLGRPMKGVIKKARKLHLNRDFFWTKKDHQFLVKNYKRMTFKEMGRHIGKTERSVSHYASRHGFHRTQGQKKWTEGELNYLQENIDKLSPTKIAAALNRSNHSVYSRIRLLKKNTPT